MKLFKDIRFYLLVIFIILCLIASWQFAKTVLPLKFLILVVLVFLFLITFFAALMYQKNKAFRVIGILLVVVFIGIGAYGNVLLSHTTDVLGKITSSSASIDYALVTLNENVLDEESEELAPYRDMSFGIMELGNTSHNRDVVEEVRQELGEDVSFSTYRSIKEASEAFFNNEVDILVMNESIIDMFEEDMESLTSVIKTYTYELDEDSTRLAAEVTSEPFIVYISGIDTYGAITTQARSDVNKLMLVNPIKKEIMLIDIPRDYYIAQTCQYGQEDKLTHTGFYGIDCSIDSVEDFLGIEVNYYAKVNFTSIVKIVDALGGIEVDSPYEFDTHKAAAGYHFEKGINHLDGMEALMFARERYAFEDGDNARVHNQTLVLEAIINKVISPSIITNYMDFMDVMADTIQTNLNEDEIYSLIQMQLSDMSSWQIDSFALQGYGATLYSPLNGFDSWVMEPDLESVEEAKTIISEFMENIY